MVKIVILVGGYTKGTRFRPLSTQSPKLLFPIAGIPLLAYHMQSISKQYDQPHVYLIGDYEESQFAGFCAESSSKYQMQCTYIRETQPMGTGASLLMIKEQVEAGGDEYFFCLHGDVYCNFPLKQLERLHKEREGSLVTLLTATVANNFNRYGCAVLDPEDSNKVVHFVEKPESFISDKINTGVYCMSTAIFPLLAAEQEEKKQGFNKNFMFPSEQAVSLEIDIISKYVSSGEAKVSALQMGEGEPWVQIKTPRDALHCTEILLNEPGRKEKGLVAKGDNIIGNVYIHENAQVHPTAIIGPNVTIAADVRIKAGVRVRNSIILESVTLHKHSCIIDSIIGWNSVIGPWARIEGDYNSTEENPISILGLTVKVAAETYLRKVIVVSHKEIVENSKNTIIL